MPKFPLPDVKVTAGFVFTLALLLLPAGCGGGSSGPLTPAPNPTTSPSGSTGGGSVAAPVQTARVVAVGPAQNLTGVDIAVASPAAGGGPNAELLGTSEVNACTTATNSGGTVRRGSVMKVILFGRALSGSLQVTIGEPADITVSNVRSISSADGTPGIAFDATVSAAAALGARTVYLRSANDDITAFAGGLEVVP